MFKPLISTVKLFTSLFGPVKSFQNEILDFHICAEDEYFHYLQEQCVLSESPFRTNQVFGGYPCHLSFLQSPFWGSFKSGRGWQSHYITGSLRLTLHNKPNSSEASSEECRFALLLLSRSLLPAKFAKKLPPLLAIAYIPFGPIFFKPKLKANIRAAETQELEVAGNVGFASTISACWNPFSCQRQYFAACRVIVQKLLGHIPLSCFFVRLDSNWLIRWQQNPKSSEAIRGPSQANEAETEARILVAEARNFGFQQAVQRVQVPDTVLLNLEYSPKELLAQMHKKHRYNIRLAQKKKVLVRTVPWQEALPHWYQIYRITAMRDRISIHPFSYYQELFALAEQRKKELHLQLYLAYAPTDDISGAEAQQKQATLGGIIVLQHYASKTATYLYGASSNEMREFMPNYLLQWQAICDAKVASMRCYDFFGIPPHAAADHPLHGLYRFKTGFGGYQVQRAGAWDMPYSWLLYAIYRLLEKGRLYLYHKKHQ